MSHGNKDLNVTCNKDLNDTCNIDLNGMCNDFNGTCNKDLNVIWKQRFECHMETKI